MLEVEGGGDLKNGWTWVCCRECHNRGIGNRPTRIKSGRRYCEGQNGGLWNGLKPLNINKSSNSSTMRMGTSGHWAWKGGWSLWHIPVLPSFVSAAVFVSSQSKSPRRWEWTTFTASYTSFLNPTLRCWTSSSVTLTGQFTRHVISSPIMWSVHTSCDQFTHHVISSHVMWSMYTNQAVK